MAGRNTTPPATPAFHGGSYTRIHPQYYKDTVIRDFRAPELGDYDVLEQVIPAARRRGMKTICWFEDVWRRRHPQYRRQAQERQFDGRNSTNLCFNNPNYRNWLLGTVEDYARSHEIDGIMWGSERQGAFAQALGAAHETATCNPATWSLLLRLLRFARPKPAASTWRALDPVIKALGDFTTAAQQHKRPIDGYYVTVWRLMLRYPELLAWEMLWTDSLRETYAAMYQNVKSRESFHRRGLAYLAQ